ncbi:hypothetical protein DYB31_004263 [Aphanomyces astaci]|uniref:Uncharacterized protein n=1 Tax=Aphanomyces astaci TaxID=112090 RepID=A0A397FFQ4_APHAT|nr:hypothetical protein DYB31_004263 [Aphanomyces astaci]
MDWCCILRLVVSLQYVQNMGLGFALYFLSPLLAHSRLFHLVLGAAIGIVCSIALLLYQLYKQSQSTLRLLPGASFLQSASFLTTLAFPVTGLMLLPTLYSLLQWALGLLFTFWSSDQVFGVPHLGKFYFVFFGAVGMAFVWWFQWWAPPNAQDYATSSFQQPNDDDGDDDDVVVWRDLRRMEAEVRLHDLRLPDNQQRLARTLQLVAIMLLFQSTSSTLISTVVVAVALLWSVLEAVYAHLYFWYWSETPGLHSTLISTDEYVAQGKTETEKALAALRQHLKDHPTVAESVREDHEVRLRRFMHGKDHMDATGKAKKDASQRSKAGARRWWGDVVANDVQRRLDEAEAQLREEAKLIDRLTRENQSKQEHIQSMEAAMANEIEKHDAIMQVFKDRELTQKQDAEHCIEVSANANATETNQSHNDEIHAMRVDMFNHKMALEQSLQELDAQYLKKAFNAMADESKVDVFVCSVFVTSELKDEAKTLRSLYDQTQWKSRYIALASSNQQLQQQQQQQQHQRGVTQRTDEEDEEEGDPFHHHANIHSTRGSLEAVGLKRRSKLHGDGFVAPPAMQGIDPKELWSASFAQDHDDACSNRSVTAPLRSTKYDIDVPLKAIKPEPAIHTLVKLKKSHSQTAISRRPATTMR